MAQPPGRHSVNPYYVVDDAPAFIAFLVDVLGGTEVGERELRSDGRIDHADVLIGDSLVMVSEADERYPARPAVAMVYVDDVDATYDRALAAGSRSIMAAADQPWGERVAGVYDPFENRWWLASPMELGR